MDLITRFGLSTSRFTYLMMVVILLGGLFSYFGLPKRENPAITIRKAVVSATFTGMAPERVENLLAVPIERKIREIGEVEDIETIITSGEVLIYVNAYDAVPIAEIANAWEDLRNKMQQVTSELPDGTGGPFVNTDFGDVSIATIAVTGDGFTLAQIKETAEELQRDLYRIEGITEVSLYGEQDERIWLDLDNRKLASVGVQLDQVLNDLKAQNVILPAGEIDANGTNLVLEANGDLGTIDEIRGVLTKVSGLSGYVRLSDLVSVRRGYVDPKVKPVFFNGAPAIVLGIQMSNTADIQSLGKVIKTRIAAFEAKQPIGIATRISTFQETAVTESVNGALSNVGQTFLVVFLVMLAFLGWRAAGVIACIVPFTVMFALMIIGTIGVDIEQVSIAAVIISLGLLVDNGLVVVEDIEGRIARGVPPETAALDAGGQYLIPLGVASITTVSAFIPMMLVDGTEGEFSYSLGAVVATMLLGSWLTALYFLPFLSARLFKARIDAIDAPPKGPLVALYGKTTRKLLPWGIPIILVVYALVALSATQFSAIKNEMFPLSERAEFLIYMDMPSGTAISETERYAKTVDAWLSNKDINPEVKSTTIFVGDGGPRFYLSLDPADPKASSAFFLVNMSTAEATTDLVARARRVLIERFPAARFRVTRLSMGGSESGIVDVQIIGPDADTLLSASRKVEAGFATAPNLVRNESDWGNKVVKVVVDIAQDKAREFGVTSEDVSSVMNAYFSGTQYSTFRDGDEQIPIVLRAAEGFRDSIEDFVNLSISANGRLISIDQLATFRPKLEFSEIRRENQVRQVVISAKSSSMSAQQLADHIRPTLAQLGLGPDYNVKIAGELEDSADVYSKIGANLPIALAVMLLALVFQFNSMRRSIITFMTIPIILIGAPYALMLAGQPMSFFGVLGLMSLMGIIINNAIVLINQIDIELETKGLEDAVVSAAEQRARPIILTSLTTVFGLVPMAISGGVLFEPMATIMIGGLLVASPLTLIFVPSVCYLFLRNWDWQSLFGRPQADAPDAVALHTPGEVSS
ncbi:MAG: efflux RND transporter permease subunit [Pseudomonadota bacterium]